VPIFPLASRESFILRENVRFCAFVVCVACHVCHKRQRGLPMIAFAIALAVGIAVGFLTAVCSGYVRRF
jgi:hypothetical protein